MTVICPKHKIPYENEVKVGDKLIVYPQCPMCIKELEDEELRHAQDVMQAEAVERFKTMNIEPLFYNSTLENFVTDTPELQKAVELVRRFIAGEIQQLIMVGKNGTGKTHLAVAAVKAMNGRIYSMYEIGTRIRATYTSRAHEDELDVVDELARLPLLVIDELGRTKGSDAEMNWLSYIIDKRHVRGLPTVIISNKHIRKDCPVQRTENGRRIVGCENCLENFISEDVMSRLTENGMLIRFNGLDWRRRKQQHAGDGEK